MTRDFNLKGEAARIPPLADAALLEIVNGIQINEEQIRYRARRNWLTKVCDKILGVDDAMRELFDANVTTGQRTFLRLANEIQAQLSVTEGALIRTQTAVREARDVVRACVDELNAHGERIVAIESALDSLRDDLSRKITRLESRVDRLDARDTLGACIDAWASGRTYDQLPWLVQVALLAHEVFSSVAFKLAGDPELALDLRKRFSDRVSLELRARSVPTDFAIAGVLDEQLAALGSLERGVTITLFERQAHALFVAPVHASIAATAAFLDLPDEERPPEPARLALAVVRHEGHRIKNVISSREIVDRIATEASAYAREIVLLARSREKR